MKKLLFLGTVILLTACGNTENTDETELEEVKVSVEEKKEEVTKKVEKPKKLTLEEKSKQFIDEHLEGKTVQDFTSALISLDDEKLESMIIYGRKKGTQFTDDFDLLGRKAVATGKVLDFVEQSHNTFNDRGRKNGSVTFTREDKFYIYMGDKNIDDFDKIEYDKLFHKDQDINNFFLGVYPEEVINFALIDLDEDATLNIGDTITIEGRIFNYVLRRDYNDRNKIEKFQLHIDGASILDVN